MQPIPSNSANASLASQASFGVSLDAFAKSAAQADQVQAVFIDGQAYSVQAQGQLSTAGGGQRSVAWVQGEVDTTALFMQAFSASFGGRLSAAVSQELGLEPNPGKPLASRLVTQALDMAQTGQQAFAGVDFLTRLGHSASSGGAAFKAAAAELAVPADFLTEASRQAIDVRMAERFDTAAAQGQSPVGAAEAGAWLRAEIAALVASSASSSHRNGTIAASSSQATPQQRL